MGGAAKLEANLAAGVQKDKVKDERSAAEKHCQPLACELQRCANRYVYKPEKCNDLKKQYKTCVADFLAAATAAAEAKP